MILLLAILSAAMGMVMYPLIMHTFPKLTTYGLPDPHKDLIAELETENYYYWTAYEFLRGSLSDEKDREAIQNQVEHHITRSKRALKLREPDRRLNTLYNQILVRHRGEGE